MTSNAVNHSFISLLAIQDNALTIERFVATEVTGNVLFEVCTHKT